MTKNKPKNKQALVAAKRLGRNYVTGNFKKGVAAIEKTGKSTEAAKKIMGAQYWKQVKARKAK